MLAVGAFVVAFLVLPAGLAFAEIEGNCEAQINGVDVASISSSNPRDAIEVGWEDTVSAGASSPAGIDGYQIRLEYAGFDWVVARGSASGNSWSRSAEIRPYATYGAGLYKVKAVSTGASPCSGAALIKVVGRNPLATVAGMAGLVLAGVGGLAQVRSVANTARVAGGGRALGSDALARAAAEQAQAVAGAGVASPSEGLLKLTQTKVRVSPGGLAQMLETEAVSGDMKGLVNATKDPRVVGNWEHWCRGIRRITFLTVWFPALLATGMVGATAGVGAASELPSGRIFPRVRWRPRIAIFGVVLGAVGGAGALVLAQQFALVYPTRMTTIAVLAGGAALNLLLTNLGQLRAARRINRRIRRAEKVLRERLAAAGSQVETPEPASSAPAEGSIVTPTGPPPSGFLPTHVIPAGGLSVWDEPDPSRQAVSDVDAGLAVRLLDRRGDWAQVEFDNGWIGWLDARELKDTAG